MAMKKEYIEPDVVVIEIPTNTLLLSSATEEIIPNVGEDDVIVNAREFDFDQIDEDIEMDDLDY